MEKEHICKFCSKSFPCGRSLGGHMRSHLINNTPPLGHHPETRPPKKKLPPLTMDHENHKACKECGKTFPSWKALFGHMKCHSPNSGGVLVMDSQSDNEAGTTPPCKRKRSDRTITTRYNTNTNTNTSITNSSSSLTIATTTTEINDDDDDDDQHNEQEEVALSLIILSRDKSYWGDIEGKNSKLGPKSIGVESLQKLKPPRVETKTRKLESLNNETEVGYDEFEVNSPKKLIKRRHHDQFGREANINSNSNSKFRCSICKKDFRSYQALGGHRASHKKFKGCCAPRSSLETEDSHSQKSKEHECPVCFKVFPSGQALGGHKRSHLIADQAKASPPHQTADRAFLDLNLPAPTEEEECGEFEPWWIGGAARLGLLSTS